MRHNRLPSGFSMLEMMTGVVVMAMVGVLIYGASYGTMRSQKAIEENTAIQDLGSVVMGKIREDLEQSFFVEAARKTTRFRGEDAGDRDRLTFSTLSHFRSSPTAHESDQAQVTYFVEDNPELPGRLLLRRAEEPIVASRPMAETINTASLTNIVTLADKVVSFNVDYALEAEFRGTWDTLKEETLNKLPRLVRVSLVLRDEKDRERIFQSVVDLPMFAALGVDDLGASPSASPSAPPGGNGAAQGTPPQGGQVPPGSGSPRSPRVPGGRRF